MELAGRNSSATVAGQNQTLISTLIEQAPKGVYVVNADLRLLLVNARALPVFKSIDPVMGRELSEVLSIIWGPAVGQEVTDAFRQTLKTGERYEAPAFCEFRLDLGVEQSYAWEIQRVTLPDGQFGVVCYFDDITARQGIEHALQVSEAKFRATFENAAVGIAHVAIDGSWIDVNERLCEIVGYPRQELVTKTFQDITYPDDLEADIEIVKQFLRGDITTCSLDKRYIRKDGATVWVGLTVGCVNNNDGSVQFFVAIIEDIADRKLSEFALQESQARLRQAADAAKLTYIEADLISGRVALADNFEAVMGYAVPIEERSNLDDGFKRLLDHIAPNDRQRVAEAFKAFLNPATTGKIEYCVQGDDKSERYIESVWSTAVGPGGRSSLPFATNHDVTERRRAEVHIRMLMREVNHRSKNLLSVVQAIARQTVVKSDPAAFEKRFSERIEGLAASQDLLVAEEWKGVELADLVKAQLAHFKDLIGTRVICEGPPARLTAAASQAVGMALHELATNAAKYGALSNATGKVHIAWAIVTSEQAMISISWSESGGPTVKKPKRRGFGHTVIGRMAEMAVDGKSTVDFRASGLTWTLVAPVESALETAPLPRK